MSVARNSRPDPTRLRRTVGNVLAVLLLAAALFLFFPPFYLGNVLIVFFALLIWEIGVRIQGSLRRRCYWYVCIAFVIVGYVSAWTTSSALEAYGRGSCLENAQAQATIVFLPNYAGFAEGFDQYQEYVWQHGQRGTSYFYSDAHLSVFPFVNVLHFGGERTGKFHIALCVFGFHYKLVEATAWYWCF